MAKEKIKEKTAKITKKMSFSEILGKNPELAEVLFESGMHCVGCGIAAMETLEQGALAHGLDPDKLVKKLNDKLKNLKKGKNILVM